MNLAAILKRWDQFACKQLREAASRLVAENDELRRRLAVAEQGEDFWRDQAMELQLQLCEEHGAARGITQVGRLVAVQES